MYKPDLSLFTLSLLRWKLKCRKSGGGGGGREGGRKGVLDLFYVTPLLLLEDTCLLNRAILRTSVASFDYVTKCVVAATRLTLLIIGHDI